MNIILRVAQYFFGFISLLIIGVLVFNFGDDILNTVQNYVKYH